MASVRKREWMHDGQAKTAWVLDYVDRGGKRRLKTFKTKKEADQNRVRVEQELKDGKHIPDAEALTVSQICTLFLRDAEQRLRDGRIGRSRYNSLSSAIRCAIEPLIGRKLMRDLSSSEMEDLYRDLVQKRRLSPRTARDRMFMMLTIEDFALRKGLAVDRPVKGAMPSLKGIKSKPVRTFSAAQASHLLRVAAERRDHGKLRPFAYLNCMVNLAALCGLRFGEIMGLQLRDIRFDLGLIEVRHSLAAWDELKAPKTKAGIRDVPMPDHVADMLKAWIEKYFVPNDRDLLFRTPKGGIIAAANFHTHCWRPLLKRAGLLDGGEVFHFHALRHFASSWMIANRYPITDVARLLGHSHFDTTLQIYAHPVIGAAQKSSLSDEMTTRLLALQAG